MITSVIRVSFLRRKRRSADYPATSVALAGVAASGGFDPSRKAAE
jgi:hypothetical protein